MEGRRQRRLVGLLATRLPELGLEAVPDPRAREGRWSLAQILRASLPGLMAGCLSLPKTPSARTVAQWGRPHAPPHDTKDPRKALDEYLRI